MSITEQVINDKMTKFLFQLNQMTNNKGSNILSESEFKEEVENHELVAKNLNEKLLDAKLEQIFYSSLQNKLQNDYSLNQFFEKQIDQPLVKKFVTNARLRELQSVKILRKGKSYYINELINAYYGKMIIEGIESISSKRRTLNKEEFELIKTQCLRIKLELPEEIEPTTTENFFNEERDREET